MSAQLPIQDYNRFLRETRLPVITKRQRPAPLLVHLPYASDNKIWLRDKQRNKPTWNKDHAAWEVPQAWFERMIPRLFTRYQACYVIQIYREKEVCAAACWNAVGADCECSCMGAHHGSGQPSGRWYEVGDSFAVMMGEERYSARLLKSSGGLTGRAG